MRSAAVRRLAALVAVIFACALGFYVWVGDNGAAGKPTAGEAGGDGTVAPVRDIGDVGKSGKNVKTDGGGTTAAGGNGAAKAADDESPAENDGDGKDAEEKLVDAFDNLTDAWMEPAQKGIAMADVDKFVSAFKALPANRRDECVHRALNLVPDENVMLLAGLLMDKTIDNETRETVFNDILNRDEDVKKPILQEVFKDKTHPCWADTAWILDVTGETPGAKK